MTTRGSIAKRYLAILLLLSACTSAPVPIVPVEDEPRETEKPPAVDLSRVENLLGSIADRMDRLENRQDWIEDANRKSVDLQVTVAEARHYEGILETISKSARPNITQLACQEAFEVLRATRERAVRLIDELDDLGALSKVEIDLENALLEAKGCVVNYGEVAYMYFDLDRRAVPGGWNMAFAEENRRLVDKILATCSKPDLKSGVIHLYGYSCDLGTLDYDERLALERAENLESYLEDVVARGCGSADIRIEAHLGGIIQLIDPEGKEAELLDYQRERNRVVALFLFNEDR